MIIEGKTLFADGFEEAICGTSDDGRVIYSKVGMVEKLVSEDDMDVMEAIEYLEFNTWNTHVGEYTPVYINDFDSDFEELKEHINA